MLIGYLFGLMPGVGASAAVFVAYGQAKQTSKHPELFGTGIVEGVIAPESCDNAKESGSLLTTLALGIPGRATGAMYLGALIMMGLVPGPEMITKHLDLSLTLILIVAVANVIAAGICFCLAPHMAIIARVPGRIVVPLTLAVIFVGSFAFQGHFADVIVLLIFSVIGVAGQRFGYNLGGMFIGYILGDLLENYLFVSLQVGGFLFFLTPISLFLIFLLIAFFIYAPAKNMLKGQIKTGGRKA
jgi:TctA family transporter